MGRRSKAEMLGVLNQILDLHTNKNLIAEDIVKILSDDGVKISTRSIYRTLRTHKETAERYKKSMIDAQVLLDAVKDTPGTELIETASQLMAMKVLDNVGRFEDFDIDDPKEMLSAIESVGRTQVGIGRLKMEFSKGVTAAKNALKDEFTKLLAKQDPETLLKVIKAIDKLEVKYKRGVPHAR